MTHTFKKWYRYFKIAIKRMLSPTDDEDVATSLTKIRNHPERHFHQVFKWSYEGRDYLVVQIVYPNENRSETSCISCYHTNEVIDSESELYEEICNDLDNNLTGKGSTSYGSWRSKRDIFGQW